MARRPFRRTCPACGSYMVERRNRRTGGRFMSCSRYPHCSGKVGVPPALTPALTPVAVVRPPRPPAAPMTLREKAVLTVQAGLVVAALVAGGVGVATWRDHSPRSAYSHTICDDGWISHSVGPGTCSHHHGVDRYVYVDVPAPSGGLVEPAVGRIVLPILRPGRDSNTSGQRPNRRPHRARRATSRRLTPAGSPMTARRR